MAGKNELITAFQNPKNYFLNDVEKACFKKNRRLLKKIQTTMCWKLNMDEPIMELKGNT